MKGGEFFFAPSISFLRQLKKADWEIVLKWRSRFEFTRR
jgi:hypothetical protein